MQTFKNTLGAKGMVDLRAAVHVVMLHPPSVAEGCARRPLLPNRLTGNQQNLHTSRLLPATKTYAPNVNATQCQNEKEKGAENH